MDAPQPSSTLLRLAQSLDRPVPLPRWGVWLLSVVAGLALALGFSQWRKLSHIQEQLARQAGQTQLQATEARNLAAQAQDLARDAVTRAQLGEARLNEYTLQRSHLEQLAFDISRNRDSNLLVELESSLRLAQQQAQLTGLADPLVAALRTARQRLERNDLPRLLPVQLAIDSDLQRLTSAAVTDTAGLLVRIDRLLQQAGQLPLRNAVGAGGPPEAPPAGPHAANDGASGTPAGTADGKPPLAPLEPVQIAPHPDAADARAHLPPAAASAQAHAGGSWRGLPARIWQGIRAEARQLFRIQHIEHPDAILVTSEQAFFLRENLRLQLMNARMGLLARQNESARSDLALVQTAIVKYFDLDAGETRQALQILRQLQAHIQAVELPAITETLAAIAAAAASDSRAAAPAGAPAGNGTASNAPAGTGDSSASQPEPR